MVVRFKTWLCLWVVAELILVGVMDVATCFGCLGFVLASHLRSKAWRKRSWSELI